MARVSGEPDVLDTEAAGGLVIRGGLVRGAGFVASTLMALLGVALVTRHLGVDRFGQFQTILSLITVIGSVTDAGMATLGVREYAQRRGAERDRLMAVLLGLRLALTVVGVVIAVLVAAVLGYDGSLVLGAGLAGVGLGLTVVQTTLTIPLAVELRNVALTAVDVVRQGLTMAGYVALVAAGAGVTAFLGVQIPVGVVVVVLAVALVRGTIPLRPAVRPREWLGMLRAAAAFAMATAVGTIYLYTAQILTAAVTTDTETGLFAAAFRVFIVITTVPGLLITVAFPLLARAARDDRRRLGYAVQRLVDTTVVLGLGACVGVVVGAPVIIDVMAGASYEGAVPALRIEGVTLIASFTLAPIGFALLSLHAHRAILLANAVSLVTTLVAVALLASAFGAEGAALGTVIGESSLAAGYLIGLRRASGEMRVAFGRPLRAVPAAGAGLAVLLVPGLPSIVGAVLALLIFAVVALACRAVPEELLELVPRRGKAA